MADRYRFERELGRGGMATVYLSRDLKHDRLVALKMLHPDLAATLGPERFLREIRLTARLDHPNILPIFDSGEAAGLLWYTMPFVRGESLRERLRREIQLPVDVALELTRQLASALDYAHREGVVHRDLKPENILLAEGQARVADFGVAKGIAKAGEERLTETGFAVGTPAYMSPEQASGGQVDSRTDIYALGCIVYEMLAGEPPFSGPTPQAVIAKRFVGPLPSVRTTRPDVPAALDAGLQKALAQVPAARYATAGGFAAALSSPVVSPETTLGPSATPVMWTRLQAMLSGRILLGVIVLLSMLAAGFWLLRDQASIASGPVRLAVLPFRHLGDSSGAYLTDGLADGIRGRLASMPVLQVIASTSTEEYRDTQKPVQQIGRELDVPYLVVGKVQWTKDSADAPRLQITPELIETRSGATRWQDPLHARPSDVLEVQTAIAAKVGEALGLSPGQSDQIATTDSLTRNPAAYDAFLRAQELVGAWERYAASDQQLEAAVALYRRAVGLDSSFALAKVRLAFALARSGRTMGDTLRYHEADRLLAGVLRERPKFASALAARAKLREFQGEPAAASRLLREAAALQPNDASILGQLTWRQGSELDSTAMVTGARAVALAPRDAEMLRTVIAASYPFRDFDTLERYCNQLIALDPTDYMGYVNKALAQVFSRGDTAAAMATLRQGEVMAGQVPRPLAATYAVVGPSGWQRWERLSLGDLGSGSAAGDTLDFYFTHALVEGAQGRLDAARAYADSVITQAPKVKAHGWAYAYTLAARAYAHAIRGARPEAMRDLAEAQARLRLEEPAIREQLQEQLVPALAELGDVDRALAMARRLLEQPTGLTRFSLRFSPSFARLWGRPEFERLLNDSTLPPH